MLTTINMYTKINDFLQYKMHQRELLGKIKKQNKNAKGYLLRQPSTYYTKTL